MNVPFLGLQFLDKVRLQRSSEFSIHERFSIFGQPSDDLLKQPQIGAFNGHMRFGCRCSGPVQNHVGLSLGETGKTDFQQIAGLGTGNRVNVQGVNPFARFWCKLIQKGSQSERTLVVRCCVLGVEFPFVIPMCRQDQQRPVSHAGGVPELLDKLHTGAVHPMCIIQPKNDRNGWVICLVRIET